MKKIIGIVVVILLIPFFIFIISDIDRVPEYPNIEFQVLDKPLDKQMYLDNNFYYELPNTITEIYEELPEYIEYYENGTINLDDGNLNYTIDNDKAYLNYIDGNISLVSKPTQIISKSNNLFDKSKNIVSGYIIDSVGNIVTNTPEDFYQNEYIKVKSNTDYRVDADISTTFRVALYDENKTFISRNVIVDSLSLSFNTSSASYVRISGLLLAISSIQLNEGTNALPYQPYAEHIYPLGDGVELPKLPNGVGDIWLQNGTIERNVGKLANVDYAEYGTLEENTYTNLLAFISNNSNEEIKIFLNDTIFNHRYKTTVLDDKIIISNDKEFITIYPNDTYTSTQILEETTYKLEGYHVISYVDGKFNNIVLAFFWIIPILLIGGLFYLIFSRKE